MNITLTSLEALILKATHESLPHPDAAALEAFCTIMKDSVDGAQLAAQALAARIQSQNAREALLALSMLDRCMRRCDITFQNEIGKFRFLNEMIKLVSPKYLANRTSPEVQTKVLQLLHAWSTQYPKETKFKVAFDMLRNQGVVKETPPPLPPEDATFSARPRAKNAIFEDEEKSRLLQKLLQSKRPEDLQHANKLIKTMVREEERRNEANSLRAQEVGAALDCAGLLRDMLARAGDASHDEKQLIHELHASCARLRPALQRLAALDTQADNLDDILHAHDVLVEVSEKYQEFVSQKTQQLKGTKDMQPTNNDTLLDFAGAIMNKNVGVAKNTTLVNKPNVIDELGDIFSDGNSSNIASPLKPVSLIQNEDIDLLGDKTNKAEGWNELDSLGEQLLKQSLPENAKRIDSFSGKQVKKIPMNALEVSSPKHEAQTTNDSSLFDLDFFIKKEDEKVDSPETSEAAKQINDDVMVDITPNIDNSPKDSPLDSILDLGLPLVNNVTHVNIDSTVTKTEVNASEPKDTTKSNKYSDVKPLTDINVTLQSIRPSKVPPLTVFEEEGGLTVVLHFCRDKPRPDVNVIVISTTSKNTSPIEDYKFQAVLPKGCKVRLLPASGSSLPAYNPFLPPPALTQLMLVGRPALHTRTHLKFVLTYNCDDEMYSEMGEADNLPLDDI
ncbi:PREDICTED: ADP-ribosylation factor-binding protein GGA3 isoform X1 [Papilio xuthus]|uniref:ADP-ribosylation factor-binding protein GGA3 isoform X1 n=1 Tax=Papilio xuthus TaxID=66420 RepID=A0AAJ6Z4F2_PAPXU|nr:PREDICTED: ADP-ribosylation factor-binding protein GGA3 isoform X1 [Papilio xuthus]